MTALIDAERDSGAVEVAIGDEDDVAIAAVTAAELLVGVELATNSRRARRSAFVAELFETVALEPYGLDVARAHAGLLADVRRAGRPRGAHDLIIAATALATDRTVVTSDAKGFGDLTGVTTRIVRR